jgi:hypothetical protein
MIPSLTLTTSNEQLVGILQEFDVALHGQWRTVTVKHADNNGVAFIITRGLSNKSLQRRYVAVDTFVQSYWRSRRPI